MAEIDYVWRWRASAFIGSLVLKRDLIVKISINMRFTDYAHVSMDIEKCAPFSGAFRIRKSFPLNIYCMKIHRYTSIFNILNWYKIMVVFGVLSKHRVGWLYRENSGSYINIIRTIHFIMNYHVASYRWEEETLPCLNVIKATALNRVISHSLQSSKWDVHRECFTCVFR